MDFLLFSFDRNAQKYYHATFMSARTVIDGLEFARSGSQLQGAVAVAELPRLTDSLFDTGGELKFLVRGGHDARHRPRLQLTVEGLINLKCQRCLDTLVYPVAAESSLLVLTGKAGGETAAFDELDGIPADAHTDVWTLVEDEVLLAIPLAPRHPDEQCNAAVKTPQDRAASPFSVLAKLKQDLIRN
jgi:uncharacterized protein